MSFDFFKLASTRSITLNSFQGHVLALCVFEHSDLFFVLPKVRTSWLTPKGGSLNRSDTLSAMKSGQALDEPAMRDVATATFQNACPYSASLNRPIKLTEDRIEDEAIAIQPTTGASVPVLIALAGPKLASQMAWSAQWAAIGPYLQNLLPSWAVQVTQLVGPVAGFVIAPLVGVISDRSENKFGRRRPFLLSGAILSAICWTIMGKNLCFCTLTI
jgi:hypothetical protein